MTRFTATQLQAKLGDVLSSVQSKGMVFIKSRSRPEMVLIEKSLLDKALVDEKTRAALLADLTF